MSGLKDLAALLTDVPPEEHVNIEVSPGKWAVPFQGMWLGVNHNVPPLQPMTSMALLEGIVFIIFEDGTHITASYISCIKESLEAVQTHTWIYNGVDFITTLHPWIKGLDYSKYQAIKEAKEAVVRANSRYQELLGSLGSYENGDGDYWHMVSRKWEIEGVPSITEWV